MLNPNAKLAELEKQVVEISLQMRGPLSNFERACLHEERTAIRDEIKRLKAEAGQ